MWLNTRISNSNCIIPRFDILVEMANAMKSCHVFYVDINDRMLYGVNDEPYILHALEIPPQFLPQKSFIFRYDTLDLNKVTAYREFALFDSFPWALIPVQNIPFSSDYVQWWKNDHWVIVDGVTGAEVDFIDLYGIDTDKGTQINQILNMVANKKAVDTQLSNPIRFSHLEEYPTMQTIMANKASYGSEVMYLIDPNTDKQYPIFIFKNLVNLNKNDQCDVVIRDRIDNNNLFVADFVLRRKKNNIQYILDPYVEHLYTQFIRV